MTNKERKWDLLVDGILWKEVATINEDPEFHQVCESFIGELQKRLNRTDWTQFMLLDMLVSAFISKRRVVKFEAAHIKIAAFHAERQLEKADEPIREAARDAATFPRGEIVDTILRYESLRDRQIHKCMELMDHHWKRAQEQVSDVPGKPAQRSEGGEENQESATG